MQYECLVVGSGIAGMCAAISAKLNGAEVLIVSRSYPTKSQSSMAQGGINGVIKSENYQNRVETHITETIKSSYNLANRDAVEILCKEANSAILWLDSIGVPFSRDRSGHIAQRRLGGVSDDIASYAEDYTGLKILHTLYDYCLKLGIKFLSDRLLLEIIKDNNRACGVWLLNIQNSKIERIYSSSLVLATGGYAGIYRGNSTNYSESNGSALIVAKRAGCRLENLEFVQFHPTVLKKSKRLISESARGEGGILIDGDGARFIDELSTRDVLSQEIYKRVKNKEDVFLDIRSLGEELIESSLPQERRLAKIYEGVDPLFEPIPIASAAHYSMGGIAVDNYCFSGVLGLYACGECAQANLHGANRLGGNSLLEAVVFGLRAGKYANKFAKENGYRVDILDAKESLSTAQKRVDELLSVDDDSENLFSLRDELSNILFESIGIIRNKNDLKNAKDKICELKDRFKRCKIVDRGEIYNQNLLEALDFEYELELAELIANSAFRRDKSIGSHSIE